MERASQSSVDSTSLSGLRVLIVEDDYFVASECAAVLHEHGAQVLGPVQDVARGRALLAKEKPHCALLDVNLKGQFVFELADEMLARGIPAIFTTGYDSSFIPTALRRAPVLLKPIDSRELIRTIRQHASRE